jgi:succinyl-CoA--D-citramalate CoA-transferase
MSGALGALGAVAALLERKNSGEGQVLDVALYESVLTFMESLITDYDVSGHVRERTGATLPGVAPSNVYPTSDGLEVIIAGNQDSVFQRMAAAMGSPELAVDSKFDTHIARGQHQGELDEIVSAWTSSLPSTSIIETLAEAGVPSGSIFRAPDMLSDPHFIARNSIVTVPHPVLGTIKMQGVVPRASRTPGRINWAGPALGAHTTEVLTELLELSEAEIALAQVVK